MIHILVADDHAIVRAGVKQIIADMPDVKVTAEASRGSEVIDSTLSCLILLCPAKAELRCLSR